MTEGVQETVPESNPRESAASVFANRRLSLTWVARPVVGLIALALVAVAAYRSFDSLEAPTLAGNQTAWVSRTELRGDLLRAMSAAESETILFARDRIEAWNADLIRRMEDNYFPWLFNYFGQWGRRFDWLSNWVWSGTDEADAQHQNLLIEKLNASLGTPEGLNLEFEQLRQSVLAHYLEQVGRKTQDIVLKYATRGIDVSSRLRSVAISLSNESAPAFKLTLGDLWHVGSTAAKAALVFVGTHTAVSLINSYYVSKPKLAAMGASQLCGLVASCQKVAASGFSGIRGLLSRVGIRAATAASWATPIGILFAGGFVVVSEYATFQSYKAEGSARLRNTLGDLLNRQQAEHLTMDGSIGAVLRMLSAEVMLATHSI